MCCLKQMKHFTGNKTTIHMFINTVIYQICYIFAWNELSTSGKTETEIDFPTFVSIMSEKMKETDEDIEIKEAFTGKTGGYWIW